MFVNSKIFLELSNRKCHANHDLTSPESSNYELCCKRRIEIRSAPFLLQLLATDNFSNFLRALFKERQVQLEERFGKTIGNYLVENKVCKTELDAQIAIIPALLALGIKKEDMLEQLVIDEIGERTE